MIIKKVKDYMSAPIYVIERNENIQRARNLMFKYAIGRLPVMDDGIAGGHRYQVRHHQ